MFVIEKPKKIGKVAIYESLLMQAQGLFHDENDMIANAANLSSLIYNSLENVNWAGFYFYKNNELVLGPFHGMPACIRIELGKGVCGTAAYTRKSQVVKDVHQFDGHIACDAATRSEIVVPLIKNGELLGVLDIDSPMVARFTDADRIGVEKLAEAFLKSLD
ncbi:MAG: GAF domain-containing protein [Gammaproteobacteria bacterium]|nr:GAF domain-containing protein [Gammaproteobacteria bacterium]NNC97690.1 GAF domain-containing protein [Gammaproteobacteria bacterium]NNM12866.1 GAF domain-containing protein [Gammaproteobacteria bacterium]